MILHPYFIFNGEAREAITFYAKALGITHGEINTYGDSPMPHEAHQKDWVVHAELLLKEIPLPCLQIVQTLHLAPIPIFTLA